MKFDIVVNPAGAGGKANQFFEQHRALLAEAEHQVHYSTLEHGIDEITAELSSGPEIHNIIIVGGDGSMNEAINGIRDFSKVRIGLLPYGSANDLARDIGICDSIENHIRNMLKGETVRTMDVGELVIHSMCDRIDKKTNAADPAFVEEEHCARFNVSAGVGWDAEICRYADVSRFKKTLNKVGLGKLIYLAEAVRTIFAMNTFRCQIVTDDGQTLSYPHCVFGAFMNHRFEGGGFMFGPNAKNNDGILDLCALNDISVTDFFRLFPLAYKGRQFESPYCFETRGSSFRVRTDKPVWVHTDGEVVCRSNDLTVRILDEKLNLLF